MEGCGCVSRHVSGDGYEEKESERGRERTGEEKREEEGEEQEREEGTRWASTSQRRRVGRAGDLGERVGERENRQIPCAKRQTVSQGCLSRGGRNRSIERKVRRGPALLAVQAHTPARHPRRTELTQDQCDASERPTEECPSPLAVFVDERDECE